MAHRFVFLLICLFSMPALILAQDGAALYRRHCAMCHEASAQTRAPSRDALRQLTPERIVYALESIASPMSSVGLARTREERRALAAYLSGKPFGTEKPLDLDRMGCKQSGAFDPASGLGWNGWSPDPSNNRFQTAAAAGLDANQVARLKLKWAFAFPGDIELELLGAYQGVNSVLVHFHAKGRKAVEVMELNQEGKIHRALTLSQS